MHTGTIAIAESPASNVHERVANASAAGSALGVAHVERFLQSLEGVHRPQEPLLAPPQPQSPTSVLPSRSCVTATLPIVFPAPPAACPTWATALH